MKKTSVMTLMEEIGLIHKPQHKPNGITKSARKTCKADDFLKRDLKADEPLKKAVTDITKIKASNDKLYK